MTYSRGTVASLVLLVVVVLTAACDSASPLAPTPVTPVTPVEPTEIAIAVVSDAGLGIPEAIVTCLIGCDGRQVGTTDNQGQVTLIGNAPLTVRAEKRGYIPTEQSVTDGDQVILQMEEPTRVSITVELPYPLDADINRGIQGATVACLNGCDDRQLKMTTRQGVVTLVGRLPLTIRVEKPGHIPVEQMVSDDDSSLVIMGHEWPTEVREAIRQLGLTDVIANGDLLLIWADTRYFTGPSRGGEYNCYGTNVPAVMVREWRGWDFMINTLVHELVHAWQGRESTRPPCDTQDGWYRTESGQAWIDAIERDIQEVGPIPGFDDDPHSGKQLKDVPNENQATFYADWYMGTSWGRNPGSVTVVDFHRMAPHRSRYLEDRFGLPPR